MASRELSRWEKKRSAGIGTLAARACGLVWDQRKIGACVRVAAERVCAGCLALQAGESADLVGGSRVFQRWTSRCLFLAQPRAIGPGPAASWQGKLAWDGARAGTSCRKWPVWGNCDCRPKSACTGPLHPLASPIRLPQKIALAKPKIACCRPNRPRRSEESRYSTHPNRRTPYSPPVTTPQHRRNGSRRRSPRWY